jgi:radical SAM protein with 4Fe4S-binding SPASM domain
MVRDGEAFVAVYQTMSGGLVLIPLSAWQQVADDPSRVDPGMLELLIGQGILMREEIDEDKLRFYWREQLLNDSTAAMSKMMVTTRCNNLCGYCVLGVLENRDMSRETALAADRFYLQYILERGATKVRDQYSGAEPTLNHRIIYESASRRSSFCWGKNIDYGCTLISNGVQLKRSLVERLLPVGLKRIHVSIAGPADIHDSLRPSKLNGGKSYEIIMQNLQRISGLVPLVIECNYNDETYLRVPEMLDDLARRSIDVENVVFTPIIRDDGAPGSGTVDAGKFLYLLGQLKQRGYPTFSEPPTNACSTDFMSKFVFNTEGTLIPCPALRQPHESRLSYGSARAGVQVLAHSQLRRKLPDRCLYECELFPRVCSGGCRLKALLNTGDFNGADCQYEMLSTVLEAYIKEKVLSATPNGRPQ